MFDGLDFFDIEGHLESSHPGHALPGVEVGDDPHRDETDVNVRKQKEVEAHPGELHVPLIEPRREIPRRVLSPSATIAREAIQPTTHQVAPRVTTEGVASE